MSKPSKRGAVTFAAVEDGAPGESGLRAFEDEEFEEGAVVVQRDAPILVVVFLHERVVAGPIASGHRFHSTSILFSGQK